MRVESSQIKALWQAVVDGADDAPLEFAVKTKLREHAPDLFAAFWESEYTDPAACEWLADRLGEDYQPPTVGPDADADDEDMYDVAPAREGDEAEAGEGELAVALLRESGGTTIRKRSRHKGRRRIDAAATRSSFGGFLRICNDSAACIKYLEQDRPIEEWRRAFPDGCHDLATRMLRHDLRPRVEALGEMGAYQSTIARALNCHRQAIERLIGRTGSVPQRGRQQAA
jgi:hypothetical protein